MRKRIVGKSERPLYKNVKEFNKKFVGDAGRKKRICSQRLTSYMIRPEGIKNGVSVRKFIFFFWHSHRHFVASTGGLWCRLSIPCYWGAASHGVLWCSECAREPPKRFSQYPVGVVDSGGWTGFIIATMNEWIYHLQTVAVSLLIFSVFITAC